MNVNGRIPIACEQGEGKGENGEKEERRKEEPVGIHQYFDCKSYIIYAGLSSNYSNVRSNNNNKKYVSCGLSGNAA